jgi:hypothetical protein
MVSVLLFIDVEESTLAESAELPDRLPLHATTDKETAIIKKGSLNVFFIVYYLNC